MAGLTVGEAANLLEESFDGFYQQAITAMHKESCLAIVLTWCIDTPVSSHL